MPSNFPHYSNNGCTLHDLLKIRPDGAFWCYKTLPLTYDDSLSYYEVLCKNISLISKAMTDDVQHIEDMINCMTEFIQNMQNHLNQFIDEYNISINRIDGELNRIEGKFDGEVTRLDNKIDTEAADIRAKYVKKAGDTMTGQLDMSNNKITNVGTPTVNNDSANKKYVDDKVAALGTVLEYKGTKPNIAALPPTGNKAGDVWYVESEQSAYAWVIDTANPQGHWEEFGPPINLEPYLKKDGSVPMTGNLDMSDNKVTNVKDPTDRKDAVNMGFLIDHVLTEEGGTMTSGKISIPFHVGCNDIETESQIDIVGTDSNKTYRTCISDGSINIVKSGGGANKIIDISNKCGEQQHINLIEQDSNGERSTEIMAGYIDFHGTQKGRIVNVAEPVNDYDVANKKYVDEHGGGVQPITVTRDSAYISTATNNFTTKVLADPTAPPARPINKDQIAVYSETNQTYAENDVTGTLLVADPHSAMEAVNKRTLDKYLPAYNNIGENYLTSSTLNNNSIRTFNYHKLCETSADIISGGIPTYVTTNVGTNIVSLPIDIIGNVTKQNNTYFLNERMTFEHRKIKIIAEDGGEEAIITLAVDPNSSLYPKITLKAVNVYVEGSLRCDSPLFFSGPACKIVGLQKSEMTTPTCAISKEYAEENFIKVEGTPQEGSTIAFKNGKWTVVDHTTWNPLE